MIGKRIGRWCWTLSADERRTAVVVALRQGEQVPLSIKLRRKHDAMLQKQRKLDELAQQGAIFSAKSGQSFRRYLGA
jgi:hypothetical protein